MSLPTMFRRTAARELERAVAWYEDRRAGLGATFRRRVDATLDRIAQDPLLFAEAEDGIREARVHRYPYCIYFRIETDQIVILSVFHTSRDPESWKNRT